MNISVSVKCFVLLLFCLCAYFFFFLYFTAVTQFTVNVAAAVAAETHKQLIRLNIKIG